MSFFFPTSTFQVDSSKLILIDSDSKFLYPGTSILSTPYTSPVLAFTSTGTNPNTKTLYTFPMSPYLDLNKDPDVHETVVNSVYRHLFQTWIYNSEFEELFKYIKIVDNEPKLISSLNEKNKEMSSSAIEKKIRFIKDNIISRKRITSILEDFVESTRTNWYDIEKNTYYVKDLIFRYMKKKLKALVEKKERRNKRK